MQIYKYIILGAGPAGLTFANALKKKGEENFIVIEKEKEAGGLCKSKNVDNSPLDTGGGHFLDVRHPKANQFLFQFMPQCEWNLFHRDSRIAIGGDVIAHPFESNLWQMNQERQVKYLKSIAIAGCNLGEPEPEKFTEWIRWKLGDLIAETYMIPYNLKMFGDNLDELGTYWLDKLPNVSFEETMLGCLNREAYGTEPGHTEFYYPKNYGYGELWLRMAKQVEDHIKYESTVSRMDFSNTTVRLFDNSEIGAEYIIVTIPWPSIPEYVGIPEELVQSIQKLKYTSINITYIPNDPFTKAQWIYYPDLSLPYHRILFRSNFCPNSKGYWTETNAVRFFGDDRKTFYNEYAYPLNTISKPQIMKRLLSWSKQKNVIGLGRWGEWEHFNSDVTVERALMLAEKF